MSASERRLFNNEHRNVPNPKTAGLSLLGPWDSPNMMRFILHVLKQVMQTYSSRQMINYSKEGDALLAS